MARPSDQPTRRRRRTRQDDGASATRSSRETGRGRTSRRESASSRRRPQRESDSRAAQERTASRRQSAPRRVNAVDGFRAFAIIAVFLYHLDVAWLPSGHLGVIMFLVLTGYLVTSSLLRRMRDGLSCVPRFWGRRLARIWPPAAVMIALTVLACVIGNHVLLTKARPDVLPGLGLFENISYILRNVSYFEQIGGPSPLTHLWYLGVDAQFCLVWPLVMLACYTVMPSRATARRIALVLALASAVAMGVLYNPDAGVTRVYYGTDTRAFAPLVGAWLAYALPIGKRPARDVRPFVETNRLAIEVAGLVSLVALIVAMVLVPDTSVLLYRGGMMVAALLSAVIIATLVLPGGLLSAVLGIPPLTWLGSRSFGAYLWHYPLIQLFGAASNTAPWWKPIAVLVLTLLLAELSYRLVEQPVSSGTFFQGLVDHLSQGPAALRSPLVAGMLALVLVGIADGVGMALIPDETLVPEDAIVSTGEAADKAMDLSQGAPEPSMPAEDIPAADAVLHAPSAEKESGIYDPVLIGDSVPGDAEAFWRAACPDGLLDSYVGRRPDQALTVLDDYLAQGVVGKIVIIQAFSNTPVTIDELEHMIAACGPDRIVYLVNVRIPESEQEQINRTISECVSQHDNVHLINWNALSEGQSEWIYPDGEHLTPTGQPIYINMLVDAITDDFVAAGGTVTRKGEETSNEATGTSVVVDNTQSQDTSSDEGTTEESESDPELTEAAAPLRILMLGNSFTFYNDMPETLADMTGYEVVSHTRGSAHLSEQFDPNSDIGTESLEDLKSGDYDYVVLQEMSTVPMDDSEEYLQSMDKLAALAREGGAEPVIFATWAYDTTKYGAKSHGMSVSEMDDALQKSFKDAATATDALIANVGEAFSSASYDKRLYADDGKHPSKDGSRLAAEVIAKTIESDRSRQSGAKA